MVVFHGDIYSDEFVNTYRQVAEQDKVADKFGFYHVKTSDQECK